VKYRLVVFDSDGTLANSLPRMRELFVELAAKHGFRHVQPHEDEQFRHLTGRELLAALEIPLWKLPRIVADMRGLMRDHIDDFAPFPGVAEMLAALRADGAMLGVVSSNSAENVQRILGAANAAMIEHYQCGASMFGKASKLKGLLRACRIPPTDSIYIGDEARDGEAARRVGMAFGAVAWGQHDLRLLRQQEPAHTFTAVADIAKQLCS
jgi:phosphoglycolate phosphatase